MCYYKSYKNAVDKTYHKQFEAFFFACISPKRSHLSNNGCHFQIQNLFSPDFKVGTPVKVFHSALWIHHEWNLKSIEVEMTLDIEGKTWGSKMLLFYYLKNTFTENIISVYELLKLVTANIFSFAF